MIDRRHPFHFLLPLFEKDDAVFSFSKYIYSPDSLLDEREIFSLFGHEISEEKINQEIASLKPNQELALHSNVRIKGKSFHIPMIDFAAEESISRETFSRMTYYLPKPLILNMALYKSGRSFHAYSRNLIPPKEWLNFMGRLLLINPRDQPDIVDSRWVGHRLIGGFCSLRWSSNSGLYISLPTRANFP